MVNRRMVLCLSTAVKEIVQFSPVDRKDLQESLVYWKQNVLCVLQVLIRPGLGYPVITQLCRCASPCGKPASAGMPTNWPVYISYETLKVCQSQCFITSHLDAAYAPKDVSVTYILRVSFMDGEVSKTIYCQVILN